MTKVRGISYFKNFHFVLKLSLKNSVIEKKEACLTFERLLSIRGKAALMNPRETFFLLIPVFKISVFSQSLSIAKERKGI